MDLLSDGRFHRGRGTHMAIARGFVADESQGIGWLGIEDSPCVPWNSARDVRAVATSDPPGETPNLRRDGAVLGRRKRLACRLARP
jgi:hypothetical protein